MLISISKSRSLLQTTLTNGREVEVMRTVKESLTSTRLVMIGGEMFDLLKMMQMPSRFHISESIIKIDVLSSVFLLYIVFLVVNAERMFSQLKVIILSRSNITLIVQNKTFKNQPFLEIAQLWKSPF